ncbi:MAG: ABC transporter ATP-binding protein [Rhodobacteraceae bacterium]|nr:ABC transporter ATP-binding protein [Paracoccaceae bacterium]MCY4195539.1 ABC transporter ATP-binding protein [Paracoccaceae bacterium]MCY4326544.1 ABC transporter ATP-binding protein [Paracoccaceae bacterium]
MNQAIQHENHSSAYLVRWVWQNYLRRQLPRLLGAAAFMTVQGGMLGVLSYLMRPVFDEVFAEQDRGALIFVGLGVCAAFVVRGTSGFIQRVMMSAVGERMKFDVQQDLMLRILMLDKRFFEDNPAGDLIQRVKNDIGSVQSVWQGAIAPGFRDTISVGTLVVVALSIDWTWTLIALAGIPLLASPVFLLQKVTRKYSLRAAVANAGIIIRLEEILQNIREIKLYRAEKSQQTAFVQTADVVKRATVRTEAAVASVPMLVDYIAGLGFLGFLLVAGNDVISGEKTVGQFMSFFTAVILLFDPVKRLGNLLSAWQNLKVALERIYAVYSSTPTIIDPDEPEEPVDRADGLEVEFDRVALRLNGKSIIRNLSFIAEAGKVTAIVGPSGAGKTTVFNLLTRIIDPDEGEIRVGGQDIRSVRLAALRSRMAFVAQDSGIFDESIRDNILFGNSEAKAAQFEQVAEAAQVTEFALESEEGYDARCGPRGELLSGGQRQRVSIARALLRDVPILLLDEPTSALDLESEKRVQEAILDLAHGRTVIVIAHRLSTVKTADKIVVMRDGDIVEQGVHDELLAQEGLYSSLYRIQFRTDSQQNSTRPEQAEDPRVHISGGA